MSRARKATPTERVKASRLRKKSALSAAERKWLESYCQRHPTSSIAGRAAAPLEISNEPAAPKVARVAPAEPSGGFTAPPAVQLDEGFALTDLRELDAELPQPETGMEPPGIPGAAPATPRDPHAPCGRCAQCRSDTPAPTCPASGAVIPRPLAERDAESMAAMALGGITLAIAGMYGVVIDAPNGAQKADVAAGLAALSERYDFATVAELLPWLQLGRGTITYGIAANAQGKARQAAKSAAKTTADLGWRHDPARVVT